jgi:5-methylcytosine-specific restriction endonuclease McrA
VALSYNAWRKAVMERDGHRCVICGSDQRLHADHIKPTSRFPELMREVNNGRALCESCHRKTDTYGGNQLKGRRRPGVLHG